MIFELQHLLFDSPATQCSEHDAPDWLTSANTVKGSTMDTGWFWERHVLTLEMGQSVETDFHRVTRVA